MIFLKPERYASWKPWTMKQRKERKRSGLEFGSDSSMIRLHRRLAKVEVAGGNLREWGRVGGILHSNSAAPPHVRPRPFVRRPFDSAPVGDDMRWLTDRIAFLADVAAIRHTCSAYPPVSCLRAAALAAEDRSSALGGNRHPGGLT